MNNQVIHGKKICLIVVWLMLALLPACYEEPRQVTSTSNIRLNDDGMIRFNRYKLKTEDQQIEDMIHRYQWNMTTTHTGLRYLIYRKGNGLPAQSGREVELDYTVRLLNGKLIYSSDSTGPKRFVVGYGGVEAGLEEGLLLMRKGDKAKLIIPSYLAFGLIGDGALVPPGAALLYDLELKEVNSNQ